MMCTSPALVMMYVVQVMAAVLAAEPDTDLVVLSGDIISGWLWDKKTKGWAEDRCVLLAPRGWGEVQGGGAAKGSHHPMTLTCMLLHHAPKLPLWRPPQNGRGSPGRFATRCRSALLLLRWQRVVQPLVAAGVPYAICLGNHDIEADLTA